MSPLTRILAHVCDGIAQNRETFKVGSNPVRVASLVNKDRTAGIEPRCDFLTVIPLLDLVKAIATAWGGPRVLSLMQQPAMAVTAYGVFCGLQVTEFDSFLRFFLCHFILLSNLVLPSVNFHLENSFLAVH